VVARNPTRIGRYDLITALATGGMGRIYLGRTTGIGGFERKVVIKTLEVPLSAESDPAIAMFLDEARLLGLLHHQHIASVFEVGRDDDGRHYMVLDYLEGYSAHDVWERAIKLGAALPLDFVLTVVSAAANALHYAHTRRELDGTPLGIVHRDVTPSNVMIGHDGAVKLIDFGIAMAATRKTKTQTGFVKGKVGYLSPEQVGGRDVDPRTDVFALGILLYELTTLHRAFRDTSDLATMQRIKLGQVRRPSQLISEYPLELEAIVMKALQVDPHERYPDADSMRRSIEALGHRLRFVLGDAAVIEVMAQLFEAGAVASNRGPAARVPDPAAEWAEFDNDLTVRRDPKELLDAMRAELKRREVYDTGEATVALPAPRSRKLRAATEAADALMAIQSLDASGGFPLVAPPPTPPATATTDQPAAEQPVARPAIAAADPPAFKVTINRPPADPANPVIGASLVHAQHQRTSRLRWIGASAIVVVLGAVVYLVTRDSSDAVAGATSPPVVPPTWARVPQLPPAPPRPVRAEPPPPPLPTKIRIRVVTRPSDATVLLDGKRLGHTPFDETLAADPGKHVIKLRHRGYATQVLDVGLDADVTEDLTLIPQR
jgi:eukaryotic-like serine/threonine-protein kinase